MTCEWMTSQFAMLDPSSFLPTGGDDANPSAPAPREMTELESQLSNLERDLSNVNTNYVALRKNHLELLELKNVLQKSETFLSETNLQIADGGGSSEESRSECVSVFRTQF